MTEPTTFSDGPIDGVVVAELESHVDERGWLMELFRQDEMEPGLAPIMGYVSETNPGTLRGPHQHHRQTDHFVVVGSGEFEFCLWDTRSESLTAGKRMIVRAGGERPLRLTVPNGVVHAYRNISNKPARLLNFPNALYAGEGRSEPVDEIRYEEETDHPFYW